MISAALVAALVGFGSTSALVLAAAAADFPDSGWYCCRHVGRCAAAVFLKGAATAQALPAQVLPMVAIFVLVRRANPALAVLAALATGLGLAFVTGTAIVPDIAFALPQLVVIVPEFRVAVLLGLGLPLYLVTMASQNLPGFAVLRAAGYVPPVRTALGVSGSLSAIAALFGGHTVNMAAITAAICLGDDVHPDRDQRWNVGLVYGAMWVCLGLLGPVLLTVFAALPLALITAIVALALLAPLMGALSGAFDSPDQRFAAPVTIAVTGSGVAALGIGAAFLGLLAGLVIWGTERAFIHAKAG